MRYEAYPKWLYAKGGESKLVANQGAHARLGDGWYESPAEAAVAPDVPVAPVLARPTAPPPVDEDGPDPVEVVAPVAPAHAEPTAAALHKYYHAPGEVIYAKVQQMNDVDGLEELRAIEEQRPGGARKTVVRRINEKLGRLKGGSGAATEQTKISERLHDDDDGDNGKGDAA